MLSGNLARLLQACRTSCLQDRLGCHAGPDRTCRPALLMRVEGAGSAGKFISAPDAYMSSDVARLLATGCQSFL
jgi:hypothetical protein